MAQTDTRDTSGVAEQRDGGSAAVWAVEEHPDGDAELALAAVDEQQLGRVGEPTLTLADRLAPLDEVGDAMGEHARLSGARAGDDKKRTAPVNELTLNSAASAPPSSHSRLGGYTNCAPANRG